MNLRVLSLSVVIVLFTTACDRQKPLFELVPSDSSGVVFNNVIKESDTLNVLDVSNVYNGGGVGIGEDLSVAGDLYVEGNRVELNVSTLEVEDSIIVTNSLNASVGQFGLGVNNSSGNIDHSLYYNYSNNKKTYILIKLDTKPFHSFEVAFF